MKQLRMTVLLLFVVSLAWANSPKASSMENGQLVLTEARMIGSAGATHTTTSPSDTRDVRNGNYALACQQDGTYLPNMLNYITSPPVALPAGSVVQFDCFVRGNFSDPDAFPNVDYWGCEFTVDGGNTWHYMSNPNDDPNGNNYVYSDAPGDWTSFVSAYSLDGRLDNYAGDTVQIRWFFQSDADTPIGEGLFLDDVSLTVDGTQVYFEDFEDGTMASFVSEDGTATPPMWHQTTTGAYAGQSWAMNDPELGNSGGYLDHWYQTLDSPPVTIPAGAQTLTFMQSRNVEDPAGATTPYNGWDGTNVRYSTDSGATWTVLTGPTPAYNSSSMYSFGFEFNEGPNIAGWGGNSNGWQAVSFPLPSELATQEVMFRWAFASDPSYSTPDDATMFGWRIDDINIAGTLLNDGETNDGWVAASQVPIAGDLWHVQFIGELPTPVNVSAVAGDGAIDLAWEAPITGTSTPQQWDVGAWRWIVSDAQPYGVMFDITEDNSYVSKVKFFMYGNPFSGTISAYVYAVVDSVPTDLLYTVDNVEVSAYPSPTTVNLLSAGLSFNAGDQFCLAVGNFDGTGQGLLADSLSAEVPASGRSVVWGGDAWYAVTDAYTGISNLGIRAETLVATGGGEVPLSYNVYRRQQTTTYSDPLVTDVADLTYTDNSVTNGVMYYYSVSANYNAGESGMSSEVFALPESHSVITLMYDDGTAETGYNSSVGNYLAVKFTPEVYPVSLKRIQFYANDPAAAGNAIAYIWAAASDGGPPTDIAVYKYRSAISGLTFGWNQLDMPDTLSQILSGSFYVGWKIYSSTPSLGADNSGYQGNSFVYGSGTWINMSDAGLNYNLMIHAVIDTTGAVSIDQRDNQIPTEFALAQNYPNPFNPTTTIDYSMPESGLVNLTIYDINGRVVSELVNEKQTAGNYRVTVDGSRIASGVYFYRLTNGNLSMTKKMTLVK